MRHVLDTTAFSAAMKQDSELFSLMMRYRPGDIVTVPPVMAEIAYGIQRLDSSSRKYRILISERGRLLSVISILPWTSEASDFFGKIKTDLERKGELIDDFDIAIAAIALAHDCGVITANLGHFNRVKTLNCRSWKKS